MEQNWKTKALVTGVILGAVTGGLSALLLIKRAESEKTTPNLSAAEGIQVGLGVLGLMRLIAGFGTD
jgi:phage protein U